MDEQFCNEKIPGEETYTIQNFQILQHFFRIL